MWFITYIRRSIRKSLTKNSRNIIKIILIACFLVFMLQVFNRMSATKLDREKEESDKIKGNLSTEQINDFSEKIDSFIEYCEQEETNKAYEMLTDECKDKLYNNKDIFRNNYTNIYLKKGSNYKKRFIRVHDGWVIYEVDILYASIEEGITESYKEIISISEKDNKINTNGFIDVVPINKTYNNNDLSIVITDCSEYLDYRIYNLNITNKTNEEIKINSDQIIIYDKNSIGYKAELINQENTIKMNETKNIEVKIEKEVYDEIKIGGIAINGIISSQENINIDLD